jgi:hypothetical protein
MCRPWLGFLASLNLRKYMQMTFMVPSLKWKEKMSNNVKVFKAYVCEFKLETALATFITFSYSLSNEYL